MLTPDEIASRQFLIALRGYDRDEVQAFLAQVAEERRELQARIEGLEQQLREGGAEPAAAPVPAAAPADDAAPAEQPASALASAEPRAVFAALGEETTRILVAAEESARAIRERAEERARTELESSRREARDEVAGARRTASKIISDAEGRRNAVAEEIRRLEATRDRYAEDLRGAVVTVQNAMRSISTSGNAGAGGREGESAASSSGPRTDADADDPARAGHLSLVEDVEDVEDASELGPAAEDDRDDWSRDAGPVPEPSPPVSPWAPPAHDAERPGDEGDADAVLDRIERDIRAAEERRTAGLPDGPIDGDALALAGRADVAAPDAAAGADDDDEEAGSAEIAAEPDHDDDVTADAAAVAAAATLPQEQGAHQPSLDEAAEHAEAVDEVPDAADAEDEGDAVAADAEEEAEGPTATDASDVGVDQVDARALDLRNQALAAIRPGALRIVKRRLQDVQNGVLDALRRAGDSPAVNDLLPSAADLAQLGEDAQPHLATAHEAGVQDGLLLVDADAAGAADAPQQGVDAAVAGIQDALGSDITTNLRASLTQGVAAGERPTQLSERVGEVFRDLKGSTAEAIVDAELTRAYSWGLLAAWQVGDVPGKRWVRGDELRCPEDMCETNAAAGTLPLDAAFPTGEVVPPPHDGCDCTLGPAA